jgi:hypothetical protein
LGHLGQIGAQNDPPKRGLFGPIWPTWARSAWLKGPKWGHLGPVPPVGPNGPRWARYDCYPNRSTHFRGQIQLPKSGVLLHTKSNRMGQFGAQHTRFGRYLHVNWSDPFWGSLQTRGRGGPYWANWPYSYGHLTEIWVDMTHMGQMGPFGHMAQSGPRRDRYS